MTPTMFRLLSNWRAADISRRPEPREEHTSEGNIVGVSVFPKSPSRSRRRACPADLLLYQLYDLHRCRMITRQPNHPHHEDGRKEESNC